MPKHVRISESEITTDSGVGAVQSSPAIQNVLATMSVPYRSGRPKSTFTIKQSWIAPSENPGRRQGRLALIAITAMSLSRQISSNPRLSGGIMGLLVVVR